MGFRFRLRFGVDKSAQIINCVVADYQRPALFNLVGCGLAVANSINVVAWLGAKFV